MQLPFAFTLLFAHVLVEAVPLTSNNCNTTLYSFGTNVRFGGNLTEGPDVRKLELDEAQKHVHMNSLTKRKATYGDCGTFASGDRKTLIRQVEHLRNHTGKCIVKPMSCIRMACDATTGTYTPKKIVKPCNYFANYTWVIHDKCGKAGNNAGISTLIDEKVDSAPLSGAIFDEEGFHIISGYANCNHSPERSPYTYQKFGPNKKPFRVCQRCLGPIDRKGHWGIVHNSEVWENDHNVNVNNDVAGVEYLGEKIKLP